MILPIVIRADRPSIHNAGHLFGSLHHPAKRPILDPGTPGGMMGRWPRSAAPCGIRQSEANLVVRR
jgi:hypothetical protein